MKGVAEMLQAGNVVRSVAGHDKNKFYVIVEVKEDCVYIANGKGRKLEKPKCKNIKHVRKTNMVLDLNSVATNKKLRQALAPFEKGPGAAEHEGGN